MKRFTIIFWGIVFSCFVIACNKPTVVITRNYINNTDWEEGEYNGLQLSKILLTDSTISIYSDNFYPIDLREHLTDSSFCFYECSLNSHRNEIFFEKENKSTIWRSCTDSAKLKKLPGNLNLKEWYLFKYVHNTWEYYAYIDSLGEAHVYVVNPSNW
jgi:hypothetical protein